MWSACLFCLSVCLSVSANTETGQIGRKQCLQLVLLHNTPTIAFLLGAWRYNPDYLLWERPPSGNDVDSATTCEENKFQSSLARRFASYTRRT